MTGKNKFLLVCLSCFLFACADEQKGTPKPLGYFRLTPPASTYQQLNADCPFTFEYNQKAVWQPIANRGVCWGDLYFKSIRARVQLTYKSVNNEKDLNQFLEDGRTMAYKHAVKADGIREQEFNFPQKQVHGILYSIAGDAATSTQFFATDSTNHFLRGVVYFYASPNADSLKPVNDFMQVEMKHLIESLEWQNSLP